MKKSKKIEKFLADLTTLKKDVEILNQLPMEKKEKQLGVVLKEFDTTKKAFHQIPIVELFEIGSDISTILKCDILLALPLKELVITTITCVEGFFSTIDLIKIEYYKRNKR